MDLTGTFNSASGPEGDAGAIGVESSGPSPSGSGGEAVNAEAMSITPSEGNGDAAEFNRSAELVIFVPNDDEPFEDDDPVASAEAELEMLENGRAKLELKHNAKPPRGLKRIVDSEIERRREVQISALKAYLEFRQEQAGQPEQENVLAGC